jgi:hypothetical protein
MRNAHCIRGKVGLTLASILLFGLFLSSSGYAEEQSPAVLFAMGSMALADGRAGDAVAAFEALADRGVVDPVASFDRGLAYATRVRLGAELPGDLGRAAQGFEEARELTHQSRLAEDASAALAVVRGEIARRRMRAGQPAEVDPGRSLATALAGLMSETTWAILSALASLALASGLFVRWLARKPRVRVAGGVISGIAAPILAASAAMTLAARHDRTSVREAVVVSAGAHPTDDRGLSLPGATPLPEGARVEVIDARGPSSRIRFGAIDTWVSTDALRDLALRN